MRTGRHFLPFCKSLGITLCSILALITTDANAAKKIPASKHPISVSVELGALQNFSDIKYNTTSTAFNPNSKESTNKLGLTSGLAMTVNLLQRPSYALAAQISAHYNNADVQYQDPLATTDEKSKLNYNLDLSLLPIFHYNAALASFLQFGLSLGHYRDTLTSPVNLVPGPGIVTTTYTSTHTLVGCVIGAGFINKLSPHFSIYSEYVIHYYGQYNLANFQNFTVSYTHANILYNQELVFGLTYQIT